MLVGRTKEIAELKQLYTAQKSHFAAIYGRRRVGKTFLVKELFQNKFTFYTTGLTQGNTQQQLINFEVAIKNQFQIDELPEIKNWYDAFTQLMKALEQSKLKKKVLFLDELPWMDTQGSDLLLGLEYFWNSWASSRKDILLIVCGSSASWMVSKLFHHAGGLYNRITAKIKINPFTLAETEAFLKSRKFKYSREHCIEIYMALGGIAYYLDQLDNTKSPLQNINDLCFGEHAKFSNEFELLFKSLFKSHKTYIAVIRALASKNKGLERETIAQKTGIANGGNLSKILSNLEQSNFIRKYQYFGKTSKQSLYQLVDPYCLFTLNMEKKLGEKNFWIKNYNDPKFHNWSGYAFEILVLNHIDKIKEALGISGIITKLSTWSSPNAQIDLIIERADKITHLVEIKFANAPFVITKKYDAILRNKLAEFQPQISAKQSIWPLIVAPYGLANTPYKHFFVQEIGMDSLF